MYQYKIKSNGTLTTIKKAWEIPTRTQGLLVTKSQFIYSTSSGRRHLSNLYVVRRGQRDLDKAKLTCFRAPSMSEGLTDFGGQPGVSDQPVVDASGGIGWFDVARCSSASASPPSGS